MSGFFSLGGGIGIGKVDEEHHHHLRDQEHDDNIISPYSLYLFKNEEIYKKGFELWQQGYQFHQQPPHYELGVGSCSDRRRSSTVSSGIGGGRSVEGGSKVMKQGNQQLSLMMSGGGGGGDVNPKRLREDDQRQQQQQQQPSIAVAGGGGGGMGVILPAHQQHHNTSSGLEMGHFPAEVSSPAVFRCVRVSSIDDADEQLAYQTSLNIGGHVFKGILYDHGPEGSSSAAGGGGGGQLQQLITSGTTAASTGIHPTVNFVDPSSAYPTAFSAFMAGTQFFPPPRS
ncbi:hypothetical protein L6452_39355 [Arctium lappa]|uniref:Uncharacterized protein n=1 Tax=Arctium lappa TaxID=4217 RepID=A0ACB8XT90_ARCLA|nr:hypothetical protein L6452_39355 [Arctium lappa]